MIEKQSVDDFIVVEDKKKPQQDQDDAQVQKVKKKKRKIPLEVQKGIVTMPKKTNQPTQS